MVKTLANTVIAISCISALLAAVVEACTAWSVASIFLGANLAFLLCSAVFHFSVADSICVFETLFKELAISLELSLELNRVHLAAWTLVYAIVFYATFFLLLPFTFMNNCFQMSIFAYVYFAKYHSVIPVLVNWLIMPAALTTTLNAFNKVWSCVTECAYWVHHNGRISPAHKGGFDIVLSAATWATCLLLTLTFSESVYLSLHYGVAHYLVMHNAKFMLSHIQEVLLLSMISLSTFKTMFSVSVAGCKALARPRRSYNQTTEAISKMSTKTLCINLWGYVTVLVRAIVRGIQTASIGQGLKQVTVNVIDKSRSNAVAVLLLRPRTLSDNSDAKPSSRRAKRPKDKNLTRQQLIRSLRQFKLC